MVKVALWSRGAHLTKPGWSKLHTHSNSTNLALFRHKMTLYRFIQGAHTIAGGSNGSRGLSPPGSPHFNHWKCLKHYLLTDNVLSWTHCVWIYCMIWSIVRFHYDFFFIILCLWAIALCMCCLRWPAWWTVVFSGNLPQLHELISFLLYYDVI